MTAQGLKVDDYLQQASLLRLLAVMALVIAPHVTRIPWWESALVGAVLIWRALASIKQWRLPPAWIKIGITLLAFAAVQSAYGRTQGQAGGSRHCLMLARAVSYTHLTLPTILRV